MGCNFRVGQKVVFVNGDDIFNRWHRENMLIVGEVYTIDVIVDFGPEHGIGLSVDGSGRCWQSWRFRPIVERKTSIEVFRSLLNPSKTEELV